MKSPSLVLAAVTLLVGISIGVLLPGAPPPEAQSPGERERVNPGARDSHAVDDSEFECAANSKASQATATGREEERAALVLAATNPPRAEFPLGDFRESRQDRVDLDAALGPDEPGLPFPQFVDEEGAADDFERYGDGPVSRGWPEAEGRGAAESRPWQDANGESEAEGCVPLFSSCRRDSDCCVASVCRSRVGTISGSFECTPD